MDRSVFGSAVKVYPSKNNRTSRSYRFSSFAPQYRNVDVFQDDDEKEVDLFDQLVHEEKTRNQNLSNLGKSFVNQTAKIQFPKRSTVLHDVANKDSFHTEDQKSVKKKTKTKTKKRDKENTKHQSRLYSDDEEDPYFWNLSKDGNIHSKRKRRPSSKPRTTFKSERLEQWLKIEKRKKAQELRDKLEVERMKSRFSKVCSTPNRDSKIRDDMAPDISFINQVESSPESSPMYAKSSVISTIEKSSDVFMPIKFKRVTSRRQSSSFQALKEERKPISLNFEFSCCDDDNHKNSGSSDAKSVESENSKYLTCLKIENSSDNKFAVEKSNPIDNNSSLEKSDTNKVSVTTTDSYKTDEVDSSKHSISSPLREEFFVQGSPSSEIETSDTESANNDKVTVSASLVEKLNEMSIYDTNEKENIENEVFCSFQLRPNESVISVEDSRCPNKSVVCVEDVNMYKLTLEDLKVLDSENEFEELDLNDDFEKMHLRELRPNESVISVKHSCPNKSVACVEDDNMYKLTPEDLEVLDSENEYEELDVLKNMHLRDTPSSEPNSPFNLSQATDSGNSFYSQEFSPENKDDETMLLVNRLQNITFRRTTRFFKCTSKTSELNSSSVEPQSSSSQKSENDQLNEVEEEADFEKSSDEQSDAKSRFLSDSITSRRGTRFSDRRVSRYSHLFDLSASAVIGESDADISIPNLKSNLDSLPTIEKTRKSIIPRVSVFEPVLEENEEEEVAEEKEYKFDTNAPIGVNSIHNFTIRRNRVSKFSLQNENEELDGELGEASQLCFNDSLSESLMNSFDRRVSINSHRGTRSGYNPRSFDHLVEEISYNETVSYDDTHLPKEETVIAASEAAPEVTLKIDELSPIKKCKRSLNLSVSGDGRRIVEDREEEEGESNRTKIFESTRANQIDATRVFQNTTFENTSGNSSSEISYNTTVKPIPSVQFDSTSLQPIYLEKGKKWRRSFITFKNIMNHRLTMVEKEECGRFCNLKVQTLINLQSDATIIMRELQECSTLKTGFDETAVAGFEEGDTISAKCERSEKARFSLSVNVVNLSRDIDIVIHDDQNSRFENDADELDGSCARESLIDQHHEAQAGDFNNILKSSLPLLERSCTPDVAREIVLKYCNQTEPLPFEMCFPDSELKSCLKIGEGVYGEVFMMKRGSKKSVIKIIPIEGDQLVNGERQKTFEEIFAELVITVHLSDLRKRGKPFYTECFAELKNRHCVYGRYPQKLIALWKEYDLKKGSENDSPTIFKDDQLYIIFELDHGGGDVESFAFNNAQQTLSVFNQVTNALAVAEQAFEFEHRDLHWGNILVTRSAQKKTNFVIRDRENSVRLNGVKVTIIDYTLSRITIKNHMLFNDLEKDPELFIAEGDFQFEVYRMMRKAVENEWNRYVPRTNVFWLCYLLDKMLKEIKYLRKGTKLHNSCYSDLEELYREVLVGNYDSACQIVDRSYKYR